MWFRQLVPWLSVLLLSGCAPYFHQPMRPEAARLGAEVPRPTELQALPAPKEPVVAAVYKFRDQTGQYKPTLNGSSFSTAISQGTTTILMRALEESRWFKPIERENLGNLLNERKIIRSTRAEFTEQTGQKQPPLPPLLFAGIILEGGIISYDANMLTGGAGVRYFGLGASGQYRQDRVTVYLRAISTSSGQVLKTVYTSKTILSQQVDASLFRFVRFKRLLEAETGFTYNEPSEMAVKDAIEKAVQVLVLEGIQLGLWETRTPADREGPAMRAYWQEKEENQDVDVIGRTLRERRSSLGLSLLAGSERYAGDYRRALWRPGADVRLSYESGPGSRWGAFAGAGTAELAAERILQQRLYYAEAGGQWRLFPKERLTPVLLGGGGLTARGRTFDGGTLFPHVVGGAGFELLLTDRLGLTGLVQQRWFFSDRLDGLTQGKYNDYYWSGRLGLTWYLGKRPARLVNTGAGEPTPAKSNSGR
ncbi:CsgG/HfaB family protein [Hymenobacter weizhouensis]|uniref:CsgG/HfaB family protein n=1 Tax=Hymenobacter sp. YIM 151500-1 TaxID=2987689 RepID=UPI00222720EA|nr:CsgG/HfaB family protein [Hymenobacter sp. YIM 151500-1]UYZ63648.1 curli production assembly/transport component CsgG [Hymenobacter sp. YIM 151500-1]